MDIEILIIPRKATTSQERGAFFEDIVKRLMKTQRYNITQNINFTGSEIDLLCEHIDRKDEKAYVECKDRIDLSSNDLKKFVFDVNDRKVDYGYFIYTKNFKHQAAGLIQEWEKDKKYKNIYFFAAEKVKELLIDSSYFKDFRIDISRKVAKLILVISYLGDYYVTIEGDGLVPDQFAVFKGIDLQEINDDSIIYQLQQDVEQISELKFRGDSKPGKAEREDSIAEIQESEHWFDYKPASFKYFVGRKKLANDIFSFFEKVRLNNSKKRIFYINGNSGWGKSSLINQLKGRCSNKFHKKNLFLYPVDSRTAETNKFIAIAFKKAIEKSIKLKYIPKNFSNVKFLSSFDILKDDSVQELINYLTDNKKIIIIVFDQFEDIFRKGTLFKPFYKFLLDVNEMQGNIIIGFSWKSETSIPIDHPAYSLWQQAKDYATEYSVNEFELSESKLIVSQMEKSLKKKLDSDMVDHIVFNSQGFPWLVKKLCVHIYNQANAGKTFSDIYEQDFNVVSLFKADLQGLTPLEVKALKYIAKRAMGNDFFDISEVDENISNETITALVNKLLLIKSGTKYNIYWDIFRDYLITNKMPQIGETYLIRSDIQPLLETFLLFKNSPSFTIYKIKRLAPNLSEGSILNRLRELRQLGLISYDSKKYKIKKPDVEVSEEGFINYVKNKLKNNSIYLELLKQKDKTFDLKMIGEIIKSKTRVTNYSQKTTETYSRFLVNWLALTGLHIPNLEQNLAREAKNIATFTPQNKPEKIIDFFISLKEGQIYASDLQTLKLLYDLKSLGLLTYTGGKIRLTKEGTFLKSKTSSIDIKRRFSFLANKMEKINYGCDVYQQYPGIKPTDFQVKIEDILIGINSETYLKRSATLIRQWAKFITENS